MSETVLPEDAFLLYGPWSIFWALLAAVLVERFLRSSYGSGSLKMRNVLAALFGCTAVIVQFYYISGAIFADIATDGWAPPLNLRRWDCYASTKGGKQVNTFRDCTRNYGTRCTKEQPCTPCNYDFALDQGLRPVGLVCRGRGRLARCLSSPLNLDLSFSLVLLLTLYHASIHAVVGRLGLVWRGEHPQL